MLEKTQTDELFRKAKQYKEEGRLHSANDCLSKAKDILCQDLESEVNSYCEQNHSIKSEASAETIKPAMSVGATASGAPSDTEKPKIYFAHYTSAKTVFSILKDYRMGTPNGLRLSDASYSNDPSEGNYLKKAIAKDHKWLIDARKDTNAFVCSFVSGKEDIGNKITYWQAYGKDGLGCSIQLHLHFDNRVFDRVLYGEDAAQKVKNKFEEYFNLGQELYTLFHSEETRKGFAAKFWKCFDSIKFLYKDAGYEHENEYRLVKISNEPKEAFTDEHPYLRRYIFDKCLQANNIFKSGSKVIIGPKVINSGALCQFFKKYVADINKNFSDHSLKIQTKFVPSKIPYRKVW